MEIKTFIASSGENIEIADALRDLLVDPNENLVVHTWKYEGIFGNNQHPLDSLDKAFSEYDYSIFLFFGDDALTKKGKKTKAIRDNVLFETGLFLGKQSKEQCFILRANGTNAPEIPSDLIGLTNEFCPPLTGQNQEYIKGELEPVAKKIKKKILAHADTKGERIATSISELVEKLFSLDYFPEGTFGKLTELKHQLNLKGIDAADCIDYLGNEIISKSFHKTIAEHKNTFKDKKVVDIFFSDVATLFEKLKAALIFQTPLLEMFEPQLKKSNFNGAYVSLFKFFKEVIAELESERVSEINRKIVLDTLPDNQEVLQRFYLL